MDDDTETGPRLRAGVWVDAYIRRVTIAGSFAALLQKGDASAGAIWIEVSHDDGVDLWCPALSFSRARRFERVLHCAPSFEVSERMDREKRFDDDLWLIAVEDRRGEHFLLEDEVE